MSDAMESLTNAVIGVFVSWSLTVFVLGYAPASGLAVTAMFFVASFIRGWVIRAVFRKWG